MKQYTWIRSFGHQSPMNVILFNEAFRVGYQVYTRDFDIPGNWLDVGSVTVDTVDAWFRLPGVSPDEYETANAFFIRLSVLAVRSDGRMIVYLNRFNNGPFWGDNTSDDYLLGELRINRLTGSTAIYLLGTDVAYASGSPVGVPAGVRNQAVRLASLKRLKDYGLIAKNQRDS